MQWDVSEWISCNVPCYHLTRRQQERERTPLSCLIICLVSYETITVSNIGSNVNKTLETLETLENAGEIKIYGLNFHGLFSQPFGWKPCNGLNTSNLARTQILPLKLYHCWNAAHYIDLRYTWTTLKSKQRIATFIMRTTLLLRLS